MKLLSCLLLLTASLAWASSSIVPTITGPVTVTGVLTDTQLRASPVPVAVSSSALPAGASTEATLSALSATLTSLNAKVTTANTGAVIISSSALPAGASTEATLLGIKTGTDKIPASPSQDRTAAATPSAVRLTDGAAFYKGTTPADTQPVSLAVAPTTPVTGIFFQGTQPVSGPLTDTQLRASAVPISGSVTANAGTNLNTSALALDANQTNGTQKTQVVSGANALAINSNGSAPVTGISAVGAAPVNAPVSVSGVDGGGLKRHFLMDTSGRLELDTAVSLPLPTGAATSANQTTANSSLTSIDGKFGSLGQKTMAGSAPVVLATDQAAIPVILSGNSFSNINTATTTVVKSGAGRLYSICINTKNANGDTISIYNNTAGSGASMGVITTSAQTIQNCLSYLGISFSVGLTVVTTGTSNWTLSYQ